jgi:hypothetical protein
MSHELEGICDICGSSGLVGDTCPCGGYYRDLSVGVDDTLIDDEPDAYPKQALDSADNDIVPLDDLEKGDEKEETFED